MGWTEIFTSSVFAYAIIFIGIFGYIAIKDAKESSKKNIKKNRKKLHAN